jgi:hypothetical protein
MRLFVDKLRINVDDANTGLGNPIQAFREPFREGLPGSYLHIPGYLLDVAEARNGRVKVYQEP